MATPFAGGKLTDTNTKIEIVQEAPNGSTISLEDGPRGEAVGVCAGQKRIGSDPWRVAADRV
ncbi:hypothetical protein ACFWWC_12500 [Streptomyces sp. NPDC058642]|uniref:hypothetical protein n=1 Tax=Streptomyces sp. NPDC058642 TaxID=3346572 RepID=UPI00365A65D6